MKRIALLLVICILCSFSVAFADIIIDQQPSGNEVVATQEETSGEPDLVINNSGDIAENPVTEENTQNEDSGKTSNPIGGVVAIIVVIVLVALVALVSKK